MPAWLASLLVTIAVALGKVGLHWLITKFPGIPASIVAEVEAILNKLP